MFEVLGLFFMRVLGFGWAWGKNTTVTYNEVYGNGSTLMPIGMLGCVLVIMALFLI